MHVDVDPLVHRVDVRRPPRPRRTPPVYVPRQVPVEPRVRVARHHVAAHDDRLAGQARDGLEHGACHAGEARPHGVRADVGRADGGGDERGAEGGEVQVVSSRALRGLFVEGGQGEVVFGCDGGDDPDGALFDVVGGLVQRDAVVDHGGDLLWQRVRLDPAADDVRRLRGLEGEPDLVAAGLGDRFCEAGVVVRLQEGREPRLDVLGRVAHLALERLARRVLLVEDGHEQVLPLQLVDDLGHDADPRVRRWDGAVAAADAQREDDVDAALLADAGQGVDDVAQRLQAHSSLVENEFEAVGAVSLLQLLGDGARAEEAVGFLVEAEGQDDGPGGLPVLMQQVLDDGEQGDEHVLAVACAAAPEPHAVEKAREGGIGPVRGVVDGYDVLVGCEEERLQGLVGAIEGEDESQSVDVVDAGVRKACLVSNESQTNISRPSQV